MIIVVAGLPGSGKSYFAERLSLQLKAAHINSDRIRKDMRASGKYSHDDRLIIYREMARQTDALVKQGKDVVVDATFYHHTMREMFLDLAKKHDVPSHFIEIVADESLIKERLLTPREFSEADYAVYEIVRDDFEEITMPHLILESKRDNIKWMLDQAIQYINNEG